MRVKVRYYPKWMEFILAILASPVEKFRSIKPMTGRKRKKPRSKGEVKRDE